MSESFDVYLPGERSLYTYFDGLKMVKADPMELWVKLMEVRGDLSAYMSIAYTDLDSKGKPQAFLKIAEKTRLIFDLKPVSEGGLTVVQCVNLVNHFWNYCSTVKKNSNGSQISPDADSPKQQDTSAPSVET